MSDQAAMQPNDYTTDVFRNNNGEGCLLDVFSEEANPELTKDSEKALAEIAAAIHRNAPRLTRGQLELAVGWLKKWKCRDYPQRDTSEFGMHLNKLKESTEQVTLRSKAYGKLLQAFLVAMLFTVAVAAALVIGFSDNAWYAKAAPLIVAAALLYWMDKLALAAIRISVDQDRRYIMQSLRDANSTVEMVEAGLYNHMKGVMHEPGLPYDEKRARRLMFAERERIADALYFDPDNYLDPWHWREDK